MTRQSLSAPGSGTSPGVSDSRLSIFTPGGFNTTTGFFFGGFTQEDDAAGSDLVLDVDGIHVNVLAPGLYYTQLGVHWGETLTGGEGCQLSWDGNSNSMDGYATAPPIAGIKTSVATMVRVLNLDVPFKFSVFGIVQPGDELTTLGVGLDIYRIA